MIFHVQIFGLWQNLAFHITFFLKQLNFSSSIPSYNIPEKVFFFLSKNTNSLLCTYINNYTIKNKFPPNTFVFFLPLYSSYTTKSYRIYSLFKYLTESFWVMFSIKLFYVVWREWYNNIFKRLKYIFCMSLCY